MAEHLSYPQVVESFHAILRLNCYGGVTLATRMRRWTQKCHSEDCRIGLLSLVCYPPSLLVVVVVALAGNCRHLEPIGHGHRRLDLKSVAIPFMNCIIKFMCKHSGKLLRFPFNRREFSVIQYVPPRPTEIICNPLVVRD